MTSATLAHITERPSRLKRWWMAWNGLTPVAICIETGEYSCYRFTVWVHRDSGFEYFWRKHMPLYGSCFNGQRVTGFTYHFL